MIRAATANQLAEAATSADRAGTVAARPVDAKSPRFRFLIAARRVEMAAVVQVPTVGPVAVTPTPDAGRARVDVATQASVGQTRATAAVVQTPLASVKPRRDAVTTLKTLIR